MDGNIDYGLDTYILLWIEQLDKFVTTENKIGAIHNKAMHNMVLQRSHKCEQAIHAGDFQMG